MNKKSTKRALLTSILSLVLCCTMLIGTTFAWFTDTVTSAGNKIQAGNLDVALEMWNGSAYTDISESTDPIFGAGSIAQNNNAETLWEPGKTQVAYLAIKNNGSLDLEYKVDLIVKNSVKNLHDAMQYVIIPDAQPGSVTAWNAVNAVDITSTGVVATEAKEVALKNGEVHYFALAIHMEEEAGNEYQGGSVEFDMVVNASQLASEADSFGAEYDLGAEKAVTVYASVPVNTTGVTEVTAQKTNSNEKVAVVSVPKEAVAEDAEKIEVSVVETAVNEDVAVTAEEKAVSYDISVTGLKEGNTTSVKVELFVGVNLTDVKVYHKDQLIISVYNPTSGYVTFETPSFSPFTVVYNATKEYEAPAVDATKLPKATVENLLDEEGDVLDVNSIEWGNYGQWSPTEDLEATLEAAYKFSCNETEEQASNNPYANWYCDFYVKLDKDLGENELFLGGNYGTFGWVGFHNGDVTLAANEEIPLLGSVTNNPWTYAQVATYVGEFTCGVGDVNDALSGATFTVMLRLTNPADETEFYNIETITHTFK